MRCDQCGYKNADTALKCIQCGVEIRPPVGVADRYQAAGPAPALPSGAETLDLPAPPLFLPGAVILFLAALTVPLAWWASPQFPAIQPSLEMLPQTNMLMLAGALAWLLIGFLTAATAASQGQSFVLSFALAVFPVTFPLVWARITGRKLFIPYIWLAVDVALIVGSLMFWRNWHWATTALAIVLLPMAIHHLFGCGLPAGAQILGFNVYVMTAWVCFVPYALIVIFLIGTSEGVLSYVQLFDDLANPTRAAWAWRTAVDSAASFTALMGMALAWLSVSGLLWIKSLHANFRNPMV